MNETKIDFLYLNEGDMIKAGVKEMAGCVEAMEEMFKLLKLEIIVWVGLMEIHTEL